MNTDDVVYTRSCRRHIKLLKLYKAMKTEKLGILFLSITVLATAGFVSNQVFAQVNANTDLQCEAAGGIFDFNTGECNFPVGGMSVVVPQSELYGELAQQYSLWLIPAISAIGIGAFIIKRKL